MDNKTQSTGTTQERKFYHGGVGEYDLPEHELDAKKDEKTAPKTTIDTSDVTEHPEDQISS